ncbi:hypothetical protein WJX84_005467 [Apatococcus fuscideae]|uniref:Uncharacterized protein n=1 Tax=Apatococcus fuscideae TaxID=2026836 RepID=A0AAW1T8Q1_9CHLO
MTGKRQRSNDSKSGLGGKRPKPGDRGRIRADVKRVRAPRTASDHWKDDGYQDISDTFNDRRPPDPHEEFLYRDFQKYFNGRPARTQGKNVLWKAARVKGPRSIEHRNLVSTSSRAGVAHFFKHDLGRDNIYRVTVPHGTPFVPIKGAEHEILLPPGRIVPRGSAKKQLIDVAAIFAGKPQWEEDDVISADYVPSMTEKGHYACGPECSDRSYAVSDGPGSWEYGNSHGVTVTQQSGRSSLGSAGGSTGTSKPSPARQARAGPKRAPRTTGPRMRRGPSARTGSR